MTNKQEKKLFENHDKAMKAFQDLIKSANSGMEISKEDKGRIFHYLRHIPNSKKTDEEFELYCKMAKEKGIPKPDRKSFVRPLHEKYDENGNLLAEFKLK